MPAREYGGREAHTAEHRVLAAHFSTGLPQELRSARSHPALLLAVARARQMLQDHIQCQDLDLAAHLVNALAQEAARGPAAGKGTAKAGRGAAKAGKGASSPAGDGKAKPAKAKPSKAKPAKAAPGKAAKGPGAKAAKAAPKAPRGGKARPPKGTA